MSVEIQHKGNKSKNSLTKDPQSKIHFIGN